MNARESIWINLNLYAFIMNAYEFKLMKMNLNEFVCIYVIHKYEFLWIYIYRNIFIWIYVNLHEFVEINVNLREFTCIYMDLCEIT
jgi:hypothetical protein